jgi:hypothetical protein
MREQDNVMGSKLKKESEHPRFDRVRFEVMFDPKRDGHEVAYQVFSGQAQQLLAVLAKESVGRKDRVVSGERLREVLEDSRAGYFPRTRQREIFRIFQDYRARFVRAGFLRVIDMSG